MVLDTDDVRRHAQPIDAASTRLAPELKVFTLKHESFIECADQLLRTSEITVIPFVLARQQRMKRVMEVIAPDAFQTIPSLFQRTQILRLILVGFGHHEDGAAKLSAERVSLLGNVADDVPWRVVLDRLYRVEPKTIDVVLTDPVESVLHEMPTHLLATNIVVVDAVAPRSLVVVGEVRTKEAKVIPFRAEMVVNHVEHHGEAALVSRIDELLQTFRAAITCVYGVVRSAVIAPSALTGKGSDRHEFDCRDPELLQVIELRDNGFESTFRR